MNVLVVDDNVDAAESLAEVMRMLGATVDVAHDGQQALDRVADVAAPDLVLLDIGLPLMDGYQVAREWRKRYGPQSRLIALTGYGSPEDKQRATDAGFDGHIVKPVSFEHIEGLLAGKAAV